MRDGHIGTVPTFTPCNVSDEAFRVEVAEVNVQGRAVLLSPGGAEARITLHKGRVQGLADASATVYRLGGSQ